MKALFIKKRDAQQIHWNGLKILDYKLENLDSTSLAIIHVPPGQGHPNAYSKRSDKLYYVISGEIAFNIAGKTETLMSGDFCAIPQGKIYTYSNHSENETIMCHIHAPAFDMDAEVFPE